MVSLPFQALTDLFQWMQRPETQAEARGLEKGVVEGDQWEVRIL